MAKHAGEIELPVVADWKRELRLAWGRPELGKHGEDELDDSNVHPLFEHLLRPVSGEAS